MIARGAVGRFLRGQVASRRGLPAAVWAAPVWHSTAAGAATAQKPPQARPSNIAVFSVFSGAAAVAVFFFELVSSARSRSTPEHSQCDWDDAWGVDRPLGSAGDADDPEPIVAARAAGERLRDAADHRVGRRHLVLVRHAQPGGGGTHGATEWDSVAEGERSTLTAIGWRQAELAGHCLHQLFGAYELGAVYHSGATEASATAKVIRSKLGGTPKIVESALLAEGVPILPSPMPVALVGMDDGEVALNAVIAEGAFLAFVWPPTGQDHDREIVDVVVAHGNIIRYLVCRALQLEPRAWSRLSVHHGAVTWLDIDCKGAVALREFGGIGHLPRELVTYS